MDMTKEFRRWCPTNRSWSHAVKSSSGKTYMVRYGYTPTGDYQYGYTCTCEAFKFGKKECKHIKEAKKHHCMWNHEACMGSIVDIPEDGKCPVCGEELETIAIMV